MITIAATMIITIVDTTIPIVITITIPILLLNVPLFLDGTEELHSNKVNDNYDK